MGRATEKLFLKRLAIFSECDKIKTTEMTDSHKIKSYFCYLFSANVPRQKLNSDNCVVGKDTRSDPTAQPLSKIKS